MKKYLLFFITLLISISVIAQKPRTTTFEDYFRYVDKNVEMQFRNSSVELLNLTEEEIIAFDPVFAKYMDRKEEYFTKKMRLIDEFKEEIREDDSQKNEDEDRADFIEDYWEVEIAEMDLRKDYFDILEDKIRLSKAVKFFMWEKAVEDHMVRNVTSRIIPSLNYYSTKYENVDKSNLKTLTTAKNEAMSYDRTQANEKYINYVDAKLEMAFRNKSIEVLNLTEEEIIAFDPIFADFMKGKEKMFEKKMDLLADYKEEMKEDDSVANEIEDRADFIEDYMDIEIAEMKMRKRYFDILEDRIPVRKAAKFLLWEAAVEQDLSRDLLRTNIPELVVVDLIPMKEIQYVDAKPIVVEIDKVAIEDTRQVEEIEIESNLKYSKNVQDQITFFDSWVSNNRGQVDISHDYTSNGLKALVNTVELIKEDRNLDIPIFTNKKKMIEDRANWLTKDWKSTSHADWTKEAFVALAELMQQSKITEGNELSSIANKLQKDQLMTDQANVIYQFFEEANDQLQQLVDTPMEMDSASMKK